MQPIKFREMIVYSALYLFFLIYSYIYSFLLQKLPCLKILLLTKNNYRWFGKKMVTIIFYNFSI
jgi:hypothetical protein